MSDADNEQDADFPAEDTVAPKVEIEAERPGRSRFKLVAYGVGLLAIAGVAGYGYLQFQQWRDGSETAATETDVVDAGEIRALQDDVRANASSLAELEERLAGIPQYDFSSDIAAIRREIDTQLDLLKTLPSRMSSLENSVASLAGISEGARETFLLSEAEYYLQIANAQLQLANNPHLAALALRMADERVTQLADPALTGVRRTLSDELAALEVMEKPDLEGATLTLASLARVVESLPVADRQDEAVSTAADEDQGNLGAAWSSVKDAMSGLVKVTPPDRARLAVLSPDAEAFLRSNIALQLQAARLALLRGEHAIFQQSLDDSRALLEAYFNTDSEAVRSALQTISEIRNAVFTTDNPDISGSLRLLRQYRTLNETVE